MKFMIDARTLGSKPGGIGMYTYDFLLELVRDGSFELILLTDVATSEAMQHLAKMGITIESYGVEIKQSLGILKYFSFVQDSVDYHKPDLFWEPNNLLPIKLKRFDGKLIVTIHDMFPLSDPDLHGFVYPKYFRYGIKKTLKQADYITYNSKETKETTAKFFPEAKSIDSLISHIIVRKPKTYDTAMDPDILFKNIPVAGEDFFLYVGNLEKRKGSDLLIKAYDRYIELGGEKKLYLGGLIREDEIQEIYDKISAKRPGLQHIGYVEDEQKSALFRYSSGFIFPSRAEGFGIPVIEAMHYNKPILTSNLPIFKETTNNATHTFALTDSDEETIENLAVAMLGLKNADLEAYAEITKRYLPETLGPKFVNAMKTLTK